MNLTFCTPNSRPLKNIISPLDSISILCSSSMVSWWPLTDSSTEILPSSTLMSHFTDIVEVMKSYLWIGLRWFADVAVRLLFTGMIFKCVLVVLAAYLLLHPVLRGISK